MSFFLSLCGIFFLISLSTYAIPHILTWLMPQQNFLKKYGRRGVKPWAVITGGSSGIGFAFARKAASQGFNIFVVAYPDEHMAEVAKMAQDAKVEYRSIAIDFADGPLSDIQRRVSEETRDLDVALVFLNAGICIFQDTALATENNQRLFDANVSGNVRVFFSLYPRLASRPLEGNRRRGGLIMTSSQVSFFPNPFGCFYAASKSFWSSMATSLGPEAYAKGVDVMAINPGPTETRVFTNMHDLDSLKMFRKFVQQPAAIASLVWKTLGRLRMFSRDAGPLTWGCRLVTKFMDSYVMYALFSMAAHKMSDYKKYIEGREPKPLVHCAGIRQVTQSMKA